MPASCHLLQLQDHTWEQTAFKVNVTLCPRPLAPVQCPPTDCWQLGAGVGSWSREAQAAAGAPRAGPERGTASLWGRAALLCGSRRAYELLHYPA